MTEIKNTQHKIDTNLIFHLKVKTEKLTYNTRQ